MAFWKNDDPPRPEEAARPDGGIVPPRAPSGNQFRDWMRQRQQEEAAAMPQPPNTGGVDLTREMMDRIEELATEVRELRAAQSNNVSVSANLADIPNPAVARANLGISQPDIDLWGRVTRHEQHADGSESVTIENENGELIHRDALPVTYFSDRCILFTLTDAQTSRMARHRDIPWQQIFDHIVESECSRAEQPVRPSPVAGRALQLRPRREVEADE